jgi:hypothetical protein
MGCAEQRITSQEIVDDGNRVQAVGIVGTAHATGGEIGNKGLSCVHTFYFFAWEGMVDG